MKVVDHHKPKYIVLENVPAILSHDKGKTFKVIQECLVNAGYKVAHKLIKCSDYGIPQMRKRVIIVGVLGDLEPTPILEFDTFKKNVTLSQYLGKNFEKDVAYTIRCGGRSSPINDKHNWDGYFVDGKEYRLSLEDCIRLQGFEKDFVLCGTVTEKWKQLGNTIPTIFTEMIAENIKSITS
jgi:DNA (cytosine-5)-methyltransferase 1